MRTLETEPLAPHTTLRVGGPAARYVETDSTDELVDVVGQTDMDGVPLLVVGGGSNLLISDLPFEGTAVHPLHCRIEPLGAKGDAELVRCEAGARWDDAVAYAVDHSLAGISALSGIPGCMGSAVMQNVGAYGQEMGSCLVSSRLYDRQERRVVTLSAAELRLRYRGSLLRDSMEAACERRWGPTPRWVVLDVTLSLRPEQPETVSHSQLASALGVEVGTQVSPDELRREVLRVRGSKAMLADDGQGEPDYDRWSSGSFFTNPVLTLDQAASLPDEAPRYPVPQPGLVKTSAAWLIDAAGFHRGFGVCGPDSPARLSTRHTLAITNRGQAKAADLVKLARTVRDGVYERFGVTLVPETVLVGVEI